MGSKHTQIQTQVILDWTTSSRGRLYIQTQGTFRALHSEAVITVSPYPKKQNGYPDLHGFELLPYSKYKNYQYKEIRVPVYCLVEVKTIAYPKLTKEQKMHLDYCVSIGGKGYVAMEDSSPLGYNLTEWVMV